MAIDIEAPGGQQAALTAALLANINPAEALTTGASPIDIAFGNKLILITSGGTGGDEFINILSPPLNIDGYANAEAIGSWVTMIMVNQGDPGDVVKITFGGQPIAGDWGYVGGGNFGGVSLDFLGAAVRIFWNSYEAHIDTDATGGDFSAYDEMGTPYQLLLGLSSPGSPANDWQVRAGKATGGSHSGGPVALEGGRSGSDNTGPGGMVELIGGEAEGPSGDGGPVILRGGPSANGARGPVKLQFLPTEDPHIPDALWNSAGTLKISAG